jgi:hypothetical protein
MGEDNFGHPLVSNSNSIGDGIGGVIRKIGLGLARVVKHEDCGLNSRFVRGQNEKLLTMHGILARLQFNSTNIYALDSHMLVE